MKLAAATLTELRQAIESDFRFSSIPAAFEISVGCEHLRAIVALASIDPLNEERYPVPTIRLTNLLKARLGPLQPLLTEECGTALDQLEHMASLSDLVRVDGRWYLSPVRRIQIDCETSLLIGGGPCDSFPQTLRPYIEAIGRARILNHSDKIAPLVAKIPMQQFGDWLGLPYKDIMRWGEDFLTSRSKSFSKPLDMEQAHYWVRNRWAPIEQCERAGDTLLFRKRVSIFGNQASSYGIVRLKYSKSREPRLVETCSIERNDARRLQGFFSRQAAMRKSVQYSFTESLVVIDLPHPLPEPEATILSLGWAASVKDITRVWPKRYCFSRKLLPMLEQLLPCLGFELIEK